MKKVLVCLCLMLAMTSSVFAEHLDPEDLITEDLEVYLPDDCVLIVRLPGKTSSALRFKDANSYTYNMYNSKINVRNANCNAESRTVFVIEQDLPRNENASTNRILKVLNELNSGISHLNCFLYTGYKIIMIRTSMIVPESGIDSQEITDLFEIFRAEANPVIEKLKEEDVVSIF